MLKYLIFFFKGAYKIPFYYPKILIYYKNKDRYSIEKRFIFAKKLVSILVNSLGINYKIEGIEKLNNINGVMIAPNHQSFLDAITLIHLSEKPLLFLSKIETLKYPFVGKITALLDSIFLKRDDLRESVKVLKECRIMLDNNRNVAIFPEGTRTKDIDKSLGEFKAGSFKPALESKKDILPIAIDGTYKPLSSKYKKIRYVINVSVLDLYKYEDFKGLNTVEIASNVKEKINLELNKIKATN